ncbi:hypothetical protein E7W39_03735 [Cronobacter sakazakii]|nr:hypothetical protein [Cronobacter sakazakii]
MAPGLSESGIIVTGWLIIPVRLRSCFISGVTSENGIYGHSRFCNTDFDDKLACLNLSGV